uniref:Olduvai domain-containing protein n=1 Tax=Fundulus heteroclitus TaxID=8078 RepID=A0A3Q2U8Q8_FUNHE
MCTSLDCGAQWWPAGSSGSTRADASSLQRLVEDLRSQLTRSQRVIRGLQARLRSPPASAHPPKLNWTQPASLSGTEDDEGWQSSDGGAPASQRLQDKELQKFDSLIRAQARELSLLRQRLREGGAVCRLLSQHLGDSTKAFEELLRANDVDYYMGQSFREQLAQSGALAQRVKLQEKEPQEKEPQEKEPQEKEPEEKEPQEKEPQEKELQRCSAAQSADRAAGGEQLSLGTSGLIRICWAFHLLASALFPSPHPSLTLHLPAAPPAGVRGQGSGSAGPSGEAADTRRQLGASGSMQQRRGGAVGGRGGR